MRKRRFNGIIGREPRPRASSKHLAQHPLDLPLQRPDVRLDVRQRPQRGVLVEVPRERDLVTRPLSSSRLPTHPGRAASPRARSRPGCPPSAARSRCPAGRRRAPGVPSRVAADVGGLVPLAERGEDRLPTGAGTSTDGLQAPSSVRSNSLASLPPASASSLASAARIPSWQPLPLGDSPARRPSPSSSSRASPGTRSPPSGRSMRSGDAWKFSRSGRSTVMRR